MNSTPPANRQRQQTRIDATKKITERRFQRALPPLIKMDESVKAKVELFLTSR
jgi:hypothetical protein